MARLPILDAISRWPVLRQLRSGDATGLGATAYSPRTEGLHARTTGADRTVRSICPYCAVGCGQLVHVKDERIQAVEGDPDSPISEGHLCPKGAATLQLVAGDQRIREVLYRRPGGRAWERLPLETAMRMVADRVAASREETWQEGDGDRPLRRTMGIAHLGGATLDDEENYLIKKLFTALGIVQVENQARI